MRSRAGSQILSSAGFSKVLNMSGGISAWQGHQAVGSEELGLDFFTAGDFASAVSMAYTMEVGLRRFYQLLADRAAEDKTRDLLTFMAKLEDGHMAKLAALHSNLQLSSSTVSDIAEGGFEVADFLARYGDGLQTVAAVIQTGMRFEAQAYDLYTRLAAQEKETDLHGFYLQMAAEEQAHLKRLAGELEQRLA